MRTDDDDGVVRVTQRRQQRRRGPGLAVGERELGHEQPQQLRVRPVQTVGRQQRQRFEESQTNRRQQRLQLTLRKRKVTVISFDQTRLT